MKKKQLEPGDDLHDDRKYLLSFLSGKKPDKEIERMYKTYREQFIAYVQKNFPLVRGEDILDIYQESFIALYENIHSGQLTPDNLTVSLKTYLFGIGNHKLYNFIRKWGFDPGKEELVENEDPETAFWTNKRLEIVDREVRNLGEPCNRVLTLFYFDRKSIKNIAGIMNYKSEQVAKNKRLSCMEKLKNIIKRKFEKEDLL